MKQDKVKILKAYFDSGQYREECSKAVTEFFVEFGQPLEKDVAVIDIDETALSSYQSMLKRDFISDPEAVAASYMGASLPRIGPVYELYHYLLSEGVAIVFITNRPDTYEVRQATEHNLINQGYSEYSELFMRPISEPMGGDFKLNCRKQLEESGYTIIANIGDQVSDFKGGHQIHKVKIPNPFYSSGYKNEDNEDFIRISGAARGEQ